MLKINYIRKDNNYKKDFLRDFTIAGISAAISKSVTYPIANFKHLAWTPSISSLAMVYDHPYLGLLNYATALPGKEGRKLIWSGYLKNVIIHTKIEGLNFAFKDRYKQIFKPQDENASCYRKLAGNSLAGGLAGATTLCLVHPLDLAGIRLEADGAGNYKGLSHCLTSILKSEGPVGLYRGFGISLLGSFVYRAAYFGLYDTGKNFLGTGLLANSVAAFAVATFSWSLAVPFDTVRRKMMWLSGTTGAEREYTGSIQALFSAFRSRKSLFEKIFKPPDFPFRRQGSFLMLILYDRLHTAYKNKESERGEGEPNK